MPNIKSAKKRVKVTLAKTIKNKIFKSRLKTSLKKVKHASNVDERKALFLEAVRLVDKAVNKNILHKNNAARKKSMLYKLVNFS